MSNLLLTLWLLLGGFIGGFIQTMLSFAEENELSLKTAFYFATVFYENNVDRLNYAGLTIIIVAMSLLLLPGSVLVLFIACLYQVLCKLWQVYKYVFRKE